MENTIVTRGGKSENALQEALLPFHLHTISHCQEGHQITCEELAGPILSDLALQIGNCDFEIILFDTRGDRIDGRCLFFNDTVKELDGDRFASVHSCSVLDPLP